MQFTGYVGWGGSAGWGHGQLVTHEEMGLGWMFFKRCTAASVFEIWRWDVVTHKASVSEFRSTFTCGCVAGTNLITRLHVHSLLSKHVVGHYPKQYEAVSSLIFILCSGIWWGNVASQSTIQCCHLRRIFLELSLLSFYFRLLRTKQWRTEDAELHLSSVENRNHENPTVTTVFAFKLSRLQPCLRWHSGGWSELQIES